MTEDCCGQEAARPPLPAPKAAADACCSARGPVFDGMDPRYRRILWTVVAINGAMFLVEMIGGRLAGSQALKADALDFLGDTLTYGISLAVIGRSLRARAVAALFKGLSLSLMGAWIFGSTVRQAFVPGVPGAETMGAIGFLALAANLGSVALLAAYRNGDANVRSVWLCSRNDAIGNVAVMLAAVAVWVVGSAWPDLIVAALMAGVFLTSSAQILRQAWAEWGEGGRPAAPVETSRCERR